MTAVLVREEIAEAGVRLLRERGFDVDLDGESDLAETIGRYDGIIIRSATKLTAGLIEQGERRGAASSSRMHPNPPSSRRRSTRSAC